MHDQSSQFPKISKAVPLLVAALPHPPILPADISDTNSSYFYYTTLILGNFLAKNRLDGGF
jgi:hypothetical protein